MSGSSTQRFVLWFSEIGLGNLSEVGGKNASLGEMFRELAPQGIRVPVGFALTVNGYWQHLASNSLIESIRTELKNLDPNNVGDSAIRSHRIRQLITNAPLPDAIQRPLIEAYVQLSELAGHEIEVAVRSSATAEDLPEASFAGQQETYLNVRGPQLLIDSVKKCFASLFTDRAINYRARLGIDHFQVGLSVGIQRMVRSDLASAGVLFSIDTETGFRDTVLINASYGLGETVVQGSVNPDEYTVFKPTLAKGFRPIIQKRLGSKEFKLVYDTGGQKRVRSAFVTPQERQRFALSDEDILQLANWAILIEDHYSKKSGHWTPMDVEWAKDGMSGELFIVQARPETVQARRDMTVFESYHLKKKGRVLVEGHSVGAKIGRGKARIVMDIRDLDQLQEGEVLVTQATNPDWEPVMKRAAAIVTDRGGRTCHAAIVSRELGVPAVVGAEGATERITTGQAITVSCAEGDTGAVYDGLIDYELEKTDIASMTRPKTKIMMIVANPAECFRLSFLPNDGVGLARMEFIINHHVKVHPMALVRFNGLTPSDEKRRIEELTAGFAKKTDYFIETLSQGIALIAAAFYPKPVILRFSDFKTNEYSHLLGGKAFEPHEENPMLGFRGASRYYNPRYREGFALECAAVKKVREEMGLTNLKVMIPFCRTLEEGRRVINEMAMNGLNQGKNGLEVYVMCEIPSNIILADEFAEIFDGLSIGSNDLTQLILGVDRDSEIIADLFDERNPAVKNMISQVIKAAKSMGTKIGICGQAPSDYPEFAKFLVHQGVDSIALNPDVLLKTTRLVADAEREMRSSRPQHFDPYLEV
jgi:pyruvate,water dikinase